MSARIQLTDSGKDAVFKMSGGNPGAITVCLRLLMESPRIDPQSALGGFGSLLALDTLELYESRIWMLFKDVCKEDLPTMVALLRGWQLGFLTPEQIRKAVDAYGEGLNVPAVVSQVTAALPEFRLENPAVKS